jgi:hypothetical protein
MISGYIPNDHALDSIISDTTTAATCVCGRVRAGISAELRPAVLPHFEKLRIHRSPFSNLTDRAEGRWAEGLTAA